MQRTRLGCDGGLSLVKSGNTGKHLALQKLQACTTTGRDVAHLVCKTCLLHGSHGVTTSDDGNTVQLCKSVSNTEGTLGEGIHLEHTHRSVPHHSLALGKLVLEELQAIRANVKSHPAVFHIFNGGDLCVGISGEVVRKDDISGQKDLDSLLLSLGHELLCQVDLVLLNQRRSGGKTHSLVESEDHASTDDELVALVEQGLDHSNLGGNLGATNNSAERTLGLRHGTVQVVQLLLEKGARDARREVLGHTLGGGVCTVSSTEGIVDIEIGVCGKLLGEFGDILGLLVVETDILQQENGSVLHGSDLGGHFLTDAVISLLNGALQVLLEATKDRGQAELIINTLGATQVRGQQHLGAFLNKVLNSGDGSTDASIISDVLLCVKRDVEVSTHKDSLASEV
mmetsp:Transcript_36934/g.44684  ORF Transcript_36934/g.44684 Transcript_36934/m.44684 type:complete len:398 (+) Transcript_36934:235-1428(+)